MDCGERTPERALKDLMRLCSAREYCRADAMRLMERWGVDDGARESVVARLVRDRFIDEQRYCSAFVHDRMGLQGWGPVRVRRELRMKGIDSRVVEEAMREAPDNSSRLHKALRQKAAQSAGCGRMLLRQRLLRLAVSRGFPMDEAIGAVDAVMAENVDSENVSYED